MADEALAGLDEGALRKLVSSPLTVLWGRQKLTQGCRSLLMYLSVHKKEEEFGGEARGTVPGWFHLAAPEALVACSCPCQVLRPGPYPPPTVISCLNSNCQGLTHGLLQVWEG